MRLWPSLQWGLEESELAVCSQFSWMWEDNEEPEEVFINLVTLSWSQICQRTTSLNALLCNTRSLLTKTWWDWRPRERTKSNKRKNWETEEMHDTVNCQGMFFIWGGTVSFWGMGPEHRTVHEGCRSCSECNPVRSCHLRWGKRATPQTSLDCLFKRVVVLVAQRVQLFVTPWTVALQSPVSMGFSR